ALAEGLTRRLSGWHEADALQPSARAALHDVLEQPMPPELAQPYFAMEDARRNALRVSALGDLAGLVANTTPLPVAIEDGPWAGEPMRAVVRELARRASNARLVLLTTSRVEGDPVDSAFRRALGAAPVTVIELGPLRAEALQQLAHAATSALRD